MASPPVNAKGQRADGTMVYCDWDGAETTFELIACCKIVTPPPEEFNEVDDACLEDQAESTQVGTEDLSEFVFTRNSEPAGTIDAKLNTLLATKGGEATWRIVYPFATPKMKQFKGYLFAKRPQDLTRGEFVMTEYAVRRKSPITEGTVPP